jgi:hypothetical protein
MMGQGSNPKAISDNEQELLLLGQVALHLNNRELAELLLVSRKTITRWFKKGAGIGPAHMGKLALHVYANDPALAARIRAHAEQGAARIGVPPPPPLPVPPPPPPPPAPPAPTRVLLDSVVCAAHDAMAASSGALRPVLRAAFGRARELGLSVDDVERGLVPEEPKAKARRK